MTRRHRSLCRRKGHPLIFHDWYITPAIEGFPAEQTRCRCGERTNVLRVYTLQDEWVWRENQKRGAIQFSGWCGGSLS